MRGDGAYKYEPEVLDSLNEIAESGGVDFLIAIETDRDGLVFLGILHELNKRHGLSDEDAVNRIDAWIKWNNQLWSFECARCGATLEAGHDSNLSLGCVCGAAYSIDGWKKYHRDDTCRGSVTFSVVTPNGEIKCGSLDETDAVLKQGKFPSSVRLGTVRWGK